VRKDAQEILASTFLSTQVSGVDFNMTEVLFDGYRFFLKGNIKDTENRLLLCDDSTNLRVKDIDIDINSELTVAEYAREKDETPIYVGMAADRVWFDEQQSRWGRIGYGWDSRRNDDGSIDFLLTIERDNPPFNVSGIPINCYVTRFGIDGKPDFANQSSIICNVNISDIAINNTIIENVEPIEFEKYGLRLNKLTFNITPLSTYAAMDFTVTDPYKYRGGSDENGKPIYPSRIIRIDFMDKDGIIIPCPDFEFAGGFSQDNTDRLHCTAVTQLVTFDEPPSEVYMKLYDLELDDDDYEGSFEETHVVHLDNKD
jgi:hypothetical protein